MTNAALRVDNRPVSGMSACVNCLNIRVWIRMTYRDWSKCIYKIKTTTIVIKSRIEVIGSLKKFGNTAAVR